MVSATVRTNLGVFIETDRNIETSDFLKKLKQKFQHHQDIRIQINTVGNHFLLEGRLSQFRLKGS